MNKKTINGQQEKANVCLQRKTSGLEATIETNARQGTCVGKREQGNEWIETNRKWRGNEWEEFFGLGKLRWSGQGSG